MPGVGSTSRGRILERRGRANAAASLDAEAARDLIEPGRQRRITPKSRGVAERGEERLLEHVARGVLVAAEPEPEPIDLRLVALEQQLERHAIARPRSHDQIRVDSLGHSPTRFARSGALSTGEPFRRTLALTVEELPCVEPSPVTSANVQPGPDAARISSTCLGMFRRPRGASAREARPPRVASEERSERCSGADFWATQVALAAIPRSHEALGTMLELGVYCHATSWSTNAAMAWSRSIRCRSRQRRMPGSPCCRAPPESAQARGRAALKGAGVASLLWRPAAADLPRKDQILPRSSAS